MGIPTRWRLPLGLVGAALLLVYVTLLALWFGGWAPLGPARFGSGRPGPQALATPIPEALPALPAAIVYLDPSDPTELRQVDYAGFPQAGSWSLAATGGASHIVSVSPDGEYLVTLDRRMGWFEIADSRGQIVSTVPLTMAALEFGVWSADAGYVCQLAIRDPLLWQLSIMTVAAGAGAPSVVPIASLRYPPTISVAACDPASHRAVLVQPLTDSVPAPQHAQRAALVLDMTTGRVVQRVSIGDSSHGVVFSPDTRYLASIDYDRGTSSIVSLTTGHTVRVERGEVRGFSADSSRIVENSGFELQNARAVGTTSVVDWRSDHVLYAQNGWTNIVRSRPLSADLALDVLPAIPDDEPGGPADLVLVPADGAVTLIPNATIY